MVELSPRAKQSGIVSVIYQSPIFLGIVAVLEMKLIGFFPDNINDGNLGMRKGAHRRPPRPRATTDI